MRLFARLVVPVLLWGISAGAETTFKPHSIRLVNGTTLTLNAPTEFSINVALQGLRRVRFLTKAPDGRIFATDMDSLADNSRGTVYVLEGWKEDTHRFTRAVPFLTGLRNPNNVAFWTDETGQSWMYVGLTDRLVRYRFLASSMKPDGEPRVLATYPSYGLSYKYGGWHLTRTVAVAALHGRPMLYVTVGSSCNACREKEEIRATVSVMEMDGSHARILGHGLRNAVGMVVASSVDGDALFATNMGADHLGDARPEDTFFELDSTMRNAEGVRDYGWPTCYFAEGVAQADRLIADPQPSDHTVPAPPAGPPPTQADCSKVPVPFTTFPAHSSPLGVVWFGPSKGMLDESFLTALHGAGKPRISSGYKIVRFSASKRDPEDFITGFFLHVRGKPVVRGRPCGLLALGQDTFLFTDDKNGTIYAVYPR